MGSGNTKSKSKKEVKKGSNMEKEDKKEEVKKTEEKQGDKKEDKKETKTEKKEENHEKDQGKTEEKKEEFAHQTGGHAGAFLKGGEGQIMKKVGKNEFAFYAETLKKYPVIHPFLPTFYGTQEKDGNKYVKIEDLTQYYEKPSIMDIKMGNTSAGEDATPEKKAAMLKKDAETTTTSLGLRLTAMKIYNVKEDNFVTYDKSWSKSVTAETVLKCIRSFFENGEETRVDLIDKFLELLKKLQVWMNEQKDLRFYSSSLLFLYDGKNKDSKVDIKMIDFAHVHEITDGGRDEGYIIGLKNLIGLFEQLKTQTQ